MSAAGGPDGPEAPRGDGPPPQALIGAAPDREIELAAEQAGSDQERAASELAARSRLIVRRSIGSPILFAVVYSSLASAIYFSLGVIAGHALGLTPLVFM